MLHGFRWLTKSGSNFELKFKGANLSSEIECASDFSFLWVNVSAVYPIASVEPAFELLKMLLQCRHVVGEEDVDTHFVIVGNSVNV